MWAVDVRGLSHEVNIESGGGGGWKKWVKGNRPITISIQVLHCCFALCSFDTKR